MSERGRWTKLGSDDPYWAVLTHSRYKSDRLDSADRQAFFESGERDVANTLDTIRRLRADFHPRSTLDYGCGVGRLTLPLARQSRQAIGVDISVPMLEEARRNADARDVHNVEFIDADEFLNGDDSRFGFDFAYSYIVLQHVPPRTGFRITETILRRLNPGGIASLHYTYARRASLLRRIVNPLRRSVPGMNALVNLLRRRPPSEALIPMYEYHLPTLFQTFERHHCASFHVDLTDHGGHLGARFILEKSAASSPSDSESPS